VLATVEKIGRSGAMTLVTVGHEIVQDGRLALEEEQEIVYRDAAAPRLSVPSREAAQDGADLESDADAELAVRTPTTLLFRFSALTYNAHRIHYDRDYARDVEGYPGLVVHGPLQVLLMAEAARQQDPIARRGRTFSYRLVAPVFDTDGLVVSASTARASSPIRTTVRSGRGYTSAWGDYCPAPSPR
jgi:3-methylfumaryl-CoA hydratase